MWEGILKCSWGRIKGCFKMIAFLGVGMSLKMILLMKLDLGVDIADEDRFRMLILKKPIDIIFIIFRYMKNSRIVTLPIKKKNLCYLLYQFSINGINVTKIIRSFIKNYLYFPLGKMDYFHDKLWIVNYNIKNKLTTSPTWNFFTYWQFLFT